MWKEKAVWNSMLQQQESQDLPICVLQKDEKPSTLRNVAEMSAKEVFDAVKAGDEVAIEIATELESIWDMRWRTLQLPVIRRLS